LKYRKQVKVARTEEERRALVPEVEGTMGRLLDGVRGLCEQGMLTERDEELMLGEIEVLYTKLYEPYEGFREVKTMVDKRILTRFDKLRMEVRAEVEKESKVELTKAKAETAAAKTDVARNLLKAGVSRDIILQATGLTITDLENQSNIVSSAPH
jgi:hypothetical protein